MVTPFRLQLPRAFCYVFVNAFLLRATAGYASWLQCYVEFDDTEVVMNHRIVSAENANKKLNLQIRPQGSDTWIDSSSSLSAATSVTPGTIYEARFDLSEALSQEPEFEALQFVMEISEGGSFAEDKTSHCENLRAHGDGNRPVLFTADGTTESVGLVGAWAIGHSAVSLTPETKLQVAKSTSQDL